MISSIKIIGLFGERDIDINIDNQVKIIVGENGTGKSHILNIVYYLMSNKLSELTKIDFQCILINSFDGTEFVLDKEELEKFYFSDKLNRGSLGILKRYLSKSDFEELVYTIQNGKNIRRLRSVRNLMMHSHPRYRAAIRDIEIEIERDSVENFLHINTSERITHLKDFLEKSYIYFKANSIIYLPTYRRIEKGLQHLIKNNELIEEFDVEDSSSLINFGMKDTSEIIGSLLEEISSSFLQAYAELSGDMLRDLLKANDGEFEIITDLDIDIVNLVLQRVGNKITDDDKLRILEIVRTNNPCTENYPILSMIKNLVELYEGSTRKLENRIEKFVTVCNRYLVNKSFYYNKNQVSLVIMNHFSNKQILIDSLSSGEKQIVSIFAKIYLKEVNDFIMFFDEPELSLSIEWQRMLLNDILNTGNCKFLFVTTHSPFIFEEENLLADTYDIEELTEYYQEINYE